MKYFIYNFLAGESADANIANKCPVEFNRAVDAFLQK